MAWSGVAVLRKATASRMAAALPRTAASFFGIQAASA